MEFIDLKTQYEEYKREIDESIATVLASAEFIGGRYVSQLEERLADYVGRKHCITCGNGTDALQLAFMAYGVHENDAVFCPDMTFISSIEPAVMLGATPVFCDIDPTSYNIDPDDLALKYAQVRQEGILNPRFVVAVDFLGNPADYSRLEAFCRSNDLILIEDAAQGMGGEYAGRKLCGYGDIATTSFFPSKPLGCYGDGGAIFTDDDNVAEVLKSLKVHGRGSSKYDNIRIGVNSRLDNIQAAVLCVKLAHLDEEMARRQIIAAKYDRAFKNVIQVPSVAENSKSPYAQYILLADSFEARSVIMKSLSKQDIPSLIYYPKPMHLMEAFRFSISGQFPMSVDYSVRNFGLPMSAFIGEEDQARVIDSVLQSITCCRSER